MGGDTAWDTLIGWFYSSDVTWSPAQWLYETTDQDLQLTANDSGNLAGLDVWVSPGAAWWRDYLLLMTGFRVWDFCVDTLIAHRRRRDHALMLGWWRALLILVRSRWILALRNGLIGHIVRFGPRSGRSNHRSNRRRQNDQHHSYARTLAANP
jgi:hypothetical protein